jgi:predicted ATP-binding protein involved in virulence
MEITIKTDAGQVPLEAISQGTGSVMCWIGTLLQRLHETGNDRNQSQKSVLVLIDELDAHMHPKWQQMFVDAFRNEFRNVQIIATTHSPLLVGSLKPEEIWLVRRRH